MNRYINSFFIAFTCYALFTIGIFYIFTNKIVDTQEEPKTISLNHIELKSETLVEQKEQVKEENKEIKEIKKVVEKPIEKQKTTISKKVETKEVQNEKFTEKNEIVEPTSKQLQSSNIQTPIQNTKPIVDEKKEYLDKYLSQIRESINKNITYPPKAKKLLIEGIVIVRFKITENGSVEDITIIDGHKFLQSATIEAIEEASKEFPKTNKSIEIQIPIEYKLI